MNEEIMQCARIKAAFAPLELATIPIPACPDEGLLLQTICAGICHSDLHIVDDEVDVGNGNVFRHRDPLGADYVGLIPGHEICGQIVEIGSTVPSQCHLRPRDIVVLYPWRGCANCEACREGESQLCENNAHGTTDIGQGKNGGGYGGYVAVPEWTLAIRLPKNLPPKIGCMLPCSGLTAFSAIQKVRPALDLAIRIRGFANLLVVGVGGLGMWTVVLVKSVYGDKNVKVLCADTEEDKLKTSTKLGADDALCWSREATVEELVDQTTMSGYNLQDAAIDFVGLPKTANTAMKSLNKGGCLALVGLHGGELAVSLPELISRSISLAGVRVAPLATLRNLVELISVTEPEVYPPTEVVKLSEVNDVLDRMRKQTLKGRAIIQHRATEQ
ncbi:hypothetical protein CAPTEDRAFT_225941 [Capitella teleta]|uniref:Enoyl reductase (ER) domain-containing protein n=1 Tax=Capitella teleta TaxID=283909 RepID=R7TBU5_CAPTE|nr:hypothetical protein CAPTEDRAFT_225941 [Capitella teleta]|eukprot:ELT91184.1 hypothetical protein CAPTEDRAFT_225941 [Capitella teleta]